MLSKWQDDILSAIECSRKIDDYVFTKEDSLLANQALFCLMKSYVWNTEFKGAELRVSKEIPTYSYIFLPEYDDPDNSNCSIRWKDKINVFSTKYGEEDCFDYEGNPDYVFWDKPNKKEYSTYHQIPVSNELETIFSYLRNDDYYKLLLETDSSKQKENLDELQKFEYITLSSEQEKFWDIENLCHMSSYGEGHFISVFGHRYANYLDNRAIIIAKNKIGPVGMISLFDHSSPEVFEKDKDRYSISFVSTSPSYRNLGIAKELLRRAFIYAEENKKFITRTDPSELGEKYTFNSFTKLAKQEFPHIPFLKKEETVLLTVLRKIPEYENSSYSTKCKIIHQLLKQAEQIVNHHKKQIHCFDYQHIDRSELLASMIKNTKKENNPSHELNM